MLPWILAIRIEDEVLAKAFWMIAIMIRPGARNARNGTSPIMRSPRPSASAKISEEHQRRDHRRRQVWPGTLRKRRTSLR